MPQRQRAIVDLSAALPRSTMERANSVPHAARRRLLLPPGASSSRPAHRAARSRFCATDQNLISRLSQSRLLPARHPFPAPPSRAPPRFQRILRVRVNMILKSKPRLWPITFGTTLLVDRPCAPSFGSLPSLLAFESLGSFRGPTTYYSIAQRVTLAPQRNFCSRT